MAEMEAQSARVVKLDAEKKLENVRQGGMELAGAAAMFRDTISKQGMPLCFCVN